MNRVSSHWGATILSTFVSVAPAGIVSAEGVAGFILNVFTRGVSIVTFVSVAPAGIVSMVASCISRLNWPRDSWEKDSEYTRSCKGRHGNQSGSQKHTVNKEQVVGYESSWPSVSCEQNSMHTRSEERSNQTPSIRPCEGK